MTLDQFLHDLRLADLDYRLTPESEGLDHFYALCPVCRLPWALEITADSDPLDDPTHCEFFCWTGCSEFQIRRALARDVHLSLAASLEAA